MKRIAGVARLHMGHVRVEYADGSSDVLPRGKWKNLELKIGSVLKKVYDEATHAFSWSNEDAVDAPASEVSTQQGQPVEAGAEGQDEAGAASEPGIGSQTQGQPSDEALEAAQGE